MAVNAIDLLKKDHEEVRNLLSQLVATTDRAEKGRRELLGKIEQELAAHTKIEEEIFYPAFRDAGGKEERVMYHEAVEEHRAAEDLVLPDLKKTDPTSAQFSGRAKVLKELIEHHIEDEEEEMFPKAKKLLSSEDLQALGEKMAQRKKELMK